MKIISTKAHGILDYLVAFLLLIVPFVLHYDTGAMVGRIFIILVVTTIIYSLITTYEFGLINVLSMKLHLLLDVLSGITLAASPWLFGFSDTVYLPHVIIGLSEIVIALATTTKTSLDS